MLFLVIVAGCASIGETLSEKQAKQLVFEEHQTTKGKVEIVSIHVKRNAYIVKWENEGNLEGATDKVTKDGQVKMIDAYIG